MKQVIFAVFCGILLAGIGFAKTKYVAKENTRTTMKSFTNALGVDCSFCHVRDKSVNIKMTDKYDGEIDSGRMIRQRLARAMIGMQKMFNDRARTTINCMACHQGSAQLPKEK